MLTRLRRRPAVPPLAVDLVLAGVFTALTVLDLLAPHGDDGYQGGPGWLNIPLTLLMSAPLALRRIAPEAVFAVMFGAAVLPSLVLRHTVYFWAGFLPIGLMLYTLARRTDGPLARWGWSSGLVLALALDLHDPTARGGGDVLFSGLLYAAAWLAGRTVRRLDVQGAALQQALAALAEGQTAREEAAVATERSRIAAEMHDVVAHAVSLMVVQVGATRMELERDRGRQPRLASAEQTGREALVELRRTLGVLRSDSPDAVRQPLPDLAAAPALVEGFRAAGVDVRFELGDVAVLPAGTQLAVYRILQEALTNAAEHGDGTAVTASVRREEDRLLVDVVNAVPAGAGAQPEASGLAGMRARVTMYRGTLSAARSGNRFELHAVLPLDEARALGSAR